MVVLRRREFLKLGLAAGLWPWGVVPHAMAAPGAAALLSARSDVQGQHFCTGFALDGQALFVTPVPQRCHDAVPHPVRPLVAYVARRPGTQVYLLDRRSGQILSVRQARAHRHFYGHGLFDKNGERLYLVENDTREPGRGMMGVYRLQGSTLEFEREMPTYGIEPHQFAWLPDYSGFVIANGGVRTEANSREALTETVESSLVTLDLSGSVLSRDTLADARASIRHVAVAKDGTVFTGQQYIFAAGATLDEGFVPGQGGSLLAFKPPGRPLQLLDVPPEQSEQMQYYSASITVHDDLRWLAATAPRGGRVLVWDLDTHQSLLDAALPDCAGMAVVPGGLVVTSGQGRCQLLRADGRGGIVQQRLPLPAGGWDNHAVVA